MEQLIIGFSDSFPHCKAAVPRSVGNGWPENEQGID